MAQDDISFTDLIASSIHDMKNSVNLQVIALEKIAQQCRQRGDASTYDDLGQVIFQSQRMSLNLVELLGLYKMGKSIYPVELDEYAVAEVIEEAVQQNHSMLAFKGITLTVDCAADCTWYLDRELLRGVLLNALNNAYHYTTDRVHVVARISNKWLELRVEDNGPGFPGHMLVQGDVATERAIHFGSGSTGLGFYFAYQAARLHRNGERRGTLSIENGGTWGGGCFVLRLP